VAILRKKVVVIYGLTCRPQVIKREVGGKGGDGEQRESKL
jgi:hypothetical protein